VRTPCRLCVQQILANSYINKQTKKNGIKFIIKEEEEKSNLVDEL
jgi:hypothetical protein